MSSLGAKETFSTISEKNDRGNSLVVHMTDAGMRIDVVGEGLVSNLFLELSNVSTDRSTGGLLAASHT